eukprot:TRINITY_DN12550_c0_g1_i1.p1 TRINITY_DN12550_c0_g1~~TRINITY_DN12550_c0_g1_i1.p1  ORF type:complete len:268 (+),score=0.26 TRINITY_DN12550_c0_g1_i1:305-1108(+)
MIFGSGAFHRQGWASILMIPADVDFSKMICFRGGWGVLHQRQLTWLALSKAARFRNQTINSLREGEYNMTKPKPMDTVPEEFQTAADLMREVLGFVPNSILTIVKRPPLAKALMGLLDYTAGDEILINRSLRMFIAYAASLGSGCRYCQAHTSHGAIVSGADSLKVKELWRFDTSELFSERERAAIAFAFASGQQPNGVELSHFDEMSNYFSEDEVIDIVGIVSTFGFLNRWNDSFATELEEAPMESARELLSSEGWESGKHSVQKN